MTKRIITWVDLQGRYRVTSPAYNDGARSAGETEDACLERTWANIVAKGGYGILIDHPHFYVEDADQRERLSECCGNDFRWGVIMDGLNGNRDARDGAWEIDVDGRPKINMAKARVIHMDNIRRVRNEELAKRDVTYMIAIEAADVEAQGKIAGVKQTLRDLPATFDVTTNITTPSQLRDAWPIELPARY